MSCQYRYLQPSPLLNSLELEFQKKAWTGVSGETGAGKKVHFYGGGRLVFMLRRSY